jgi:hypothetical protein
MPFSTSPVGFANEVVAGINSIRLTLLGGSPPRFLFHYTSFAGVTGIAESRALRAFCVANQKDGSEIRYGAEIVDIELKKILREGVGATAEMILEGLIATGAQPDGPDIRGVLLLKRQVPFPLATIWRIWFTIRHQSKL